MDDPDVMRDALLSVSRNGVAIKGNTPYIEQYSTLLPAGLVSAVGSVYQLAFRSLQVRFLGPAHSLNSYQLLVKG